MTWRLTISSVVLAASLAFIVTLVGTGDGRVVSVQVWLATSIVIMAVFVGTAAARSVPAADQTSLALFGPADASDDDLPIRPRPLIRLDRLVVQSAGDPQYFESQLRPELRALAAHHHGEGGGAANGRRIDATMPLGDLAWLIDDVPAPRPPTPEELESFATRLLGDA